MMLFNCALIPTNKFGKTSLKKQRTQDTFEIEFDEQEWMSVTQAQDALEIEFDEFQAGT